MYMEMLHLDPKTGARPRMTTCKVPDDELTSFFQQNCEFYPECSYAVEGTGEEESMTSS
jgi:putative component of membrane protein insertase Oxa1/YidC/SpoIIIJ protein YidD